MYVFVSVCFNVVYLFSRYRWLILTQLGQGWRIQILKNLLLVHEMSIFDSQIGLTCGISTKCANLKVGDPRNSLIRITHFIRTVVSQ